MNPTPTHDLPPLDEPEHALERALAAWPAVRPTGVLGAVERRLAAHGV